MEKNILRSKYKQLRDALNEQEIQRRSQQLIDLLINHFEFNEKTVSLFLPITTKKEINTTPLLTVLPKLNARVGLSVSNFETNEMTHLTYTSNTVLKENKYGIPEPQSGTLLPDSLFDIVLVPLLAVDYKGNRVGYGKGFYDRFLKSCRTDCIFIGLHLFDVEQTLINTDTNDIPLHFVVTPKEVVRCANED